MKATSQAHRNSPFHPVSQLELLTRLNPPDYAFRWVGGSNDPKTKEMVIVGIESDAQNDLSLSDDAAEDVVGGKKKAKAKAAKPAAHKTTAFAANYTNVPMNVTPQ